MIDSIAPRRSLAHHVRSGMHRARIGFRVWRRSRPFWAGAIALIGGLPMWYFPSKAVQFLFVSRTPIWAGILVGVLVEFFALMLWIQPQFRAMYGTFVVLLSLLSFITSDFGGLFIGMLLGILGGSLALAWTPVTGKTKRQQRWLMKTRDEKPIVHATAVTTEEPDLVIVLDEPAPAEAEAPVEHVPLGEGADIDAFGWDVLPLDVTEAGPIIDVTETAAEPAAGSGDAAIEPTAVELMEPVIDMSEISGIEGEAPVEAAPEIDIRDVSIDVRDETTVSDLPGDSPTIDLREEKASTAPAQDDQPETPQ